jgi:hypothetical protein
MAEFGFAPLRGRLRAFLYVKTFGPPPRVRLALQPGDVRLTSLEKHRRRRLP